MTNTKKKIAISSFWPLQADLTAKISAAAPGYELLDLATMPADEQLAGCEILFGNVKADVIQKMPMLKWVHSQTAGVEIYLNPPLSKDILLTNSSGAYGITIAEHMLHCTLVLLRNTVLSLSQQREHIWKSYTSRILYGLKVTVVGMGDIGGRYAMLCHTMGASVSGIVRNPRKNKPQYAENLFTSDHIDEAIKDADIVALALPGTGETAGILSRERLAAMKKGVLVLNVGRGSAIDQDSMIVLLQSGHIGGAALDVTTPEPLPPDSPLWDMPNVIITPHVSNGGHDNITRFVIDIFVRNLTDYINGQPFEREVDRDAGY